MRPTRYWWAALATFALTRSACAALGGNVDSIEHDRTHIKATARALAASHYTIHELTTASGTAVREYADVNGKVFAVTWSGPAMPDLRQLLGDYFAAYTSDPGARRNGHAHRTVEHAGLVVQSGGRMRAFSGKAYLPPMIPTGVTIDELR